MTQTIRTIIGTIIDRARFGGLLGLCAATLLGGCGGDAPPHLQGARPGADRQAPVMKALPSPDSGRPHEGGVAPADEMRGSQAGPAIGATVAGKGGQKAQKEAAEKQAAELSRKAREARAATPPESAPVDSPPTGQLPSED
ncbi:MAG: hypothetical protein A3D94_22195 [Alphaproteobacteria bacterium RIFCSPHIGHO2_12_FULL_66_14]|jgi:hypothetical protein|nr:MAG: hypothetical protein A3D94_22195 [Alphaproteobacteria bacterium RIFCSPHIGHO2_12_FULL_66_14]